MYFVACFPYFSSMAKKINWLVPMLTICTRAMGTRHRDSRSSTIISTVLKAKRCNFSLGKKKWGLNTQLYGTITVKDYANIDFLIKLNHTKVLKNYKQIYIYYSRLSKYTKCVVHIVNPQHSSGRKNKVLQMKNSFAKIVNEQSVWKLCQLLKCVLLFS